MANITQLNAGPNFHAIEAIILRGDLSQLSDAQRSQYVNKLCEVMGGLNPLTKPFDFITLNGKLTCYAGKNCAEQLRRIHGVSLRVTAREKIDDVYVVTVEAGLPNGRVDGATGAVALGNLRGDMLANAMMKAETKAKRRATLSICGLGMLDETEIETIPDAKKGVFPEQPEEGNGVVSNSYIVPYGPLAKQAIEECDPAKLREYIFGIEEKAEKMGKPIPAWAQELIRNAEPLIAAYENASEQSEFEKFDEKYVK